MSGATAGAPSPRPSPTAGASEGPGPKPPEDHIVVLRDLRKSFGEQQVLRGIDLVARRGETTVLIGGSGAGKTTLLRIIVALERATSGEVWIDGEEITRLPEKDLNRIRRKFGVVYQYAALLDSISVLDNVAFPLVEHTKLSKKEIRDRVMEKLRVLGLDPDVVAPKFPAELSGGMRKRAALARAMALDPELLFLDEPTAGLDPLSPTGFDELVRSLRDNLGLTLVVITHDLDLLWRVADRVAFMADGHILGVGTMKDLSTSDHPVLSQYFHGPRGRSAWDQAWKAR